MNTKIYNLWRRGFAVGMLSLLLTICSMAGAQIPGYNHNRYGGNHNPSIGVRGVKVVEVHKDFSGLYCRRGTQNAPLSAVEWIMNTLQIRLTPSIHWEPDFDLN